MKNISYILTFLVLSLCISSLYRADTTELSTSELGEYIGELKLKQQDFKDMNLSTLKEYGDIMGFLKENLTSDEKIDIRNTLLNYLEQRNMIEYDIEINKTSKLNTKSKENELLRLKTNIYKFIYNYVAKDKREEFLNYIIFDLSSTKEINELIEEIQKSEIILDEKVAYYRERIDIHQKNLQSQVDLIITKEIREKLNDIESNSKYISIPKETKDELYREFIKKLKLKKLEIKNSSLSDSYKNIKLNIFNTFIDEIDKNISK